MNAAHSTRAERIRHTSGSFGDVHLPSHEDVQLVWPLQLKVGDMSVLLIARPATIPLLHL